MKRVFFFITLLMFTLGSSIAFADNATFPGLSKNPVVNVKGGDSQITAKEAQAMLDRIDEIRAIDKSDLTKVEKAELKKELKDMKQSIRKDGGYIVIGTGTLVLIIILILLLT